MIKLKKCVLRQYVPLHLTYWRINYFLYNTSLVLSVIVNENYNLLNIVQLLLLLFNINQKFEREDHAFLKSIYVVVY